MTYRGGAIPFSLLVPSALLLAVVAAGGEPARIPSSPAAAGSYFDLSGVWCPVNPVRLSGHALVHDLRHDRLVALLGGSGELAEFNLSVFTKSLDAPGGSWERSGSLDEFDPGAFWVGRTGAAVARDPVTGHAYLFGGVIGSTDITGATIVTNEILEVVPEDVPRVQRLPSQGPAPLQRSGAAAAFDSKRQRLLVFGGDVTRPGGAVVLLPANDLWEFDLVGAGGWRDLRPGGSLPPPGSATDAIYDPIGDRLVILAGDGGVWVLEFSEPLEWRELETLGDAPTHPGGYVYHYIRAQYDPLRHSAVCRTSTAPHSVWRLRLSDPPLWTRHELPGSAPPADAPFLVDAKADRLIAHGGSEDYVPHSGTWSLPLQLSESWRSLDSRSAPQPQAWLSAEWDPTRQAIVCVGSGTMPSGEKAVQAWVIAGSRSLEWRLFREGNEAPDVLQATTIASAFDPRSPGTLFIAQDPASGATSVIRLDLTGHGTRWDELMVSGTGPPPVPWMSALEDDSRDRILVFAAGSDGLQVWELLLEGELRWRRLEVPSPFPGLRTRMATVYDPLAERAILIGGTDGVAPTGEVWALSLGGTPEWSRHPDTAPVYGGAAVFNPVQERVVFLPGAGTAYDDWFQINYLSLRSEPHWTSEGIWPFVGGSPSFFDDWPCPRSSVPAAYHPMLDAFLLLGGRVEVPYSPACDGIAGASGWYYLWDEAEREVRADVNPGNAQNPIPLGSHRPISLALFDTPAKTPHGTPVEVAKIDPSTVRLAGASMKRNRQGEPEFSYRDVDKDGVVDLLVHFDVDELQLEPGTDVAQVAAATFAGARLRGSDQVRVVGHGGGRQARRDGNLTPTSATAAEIPSELCLRPAGSNGSEMRLTAELPLSGDATIELFDVSGRRRHSEKFPALSAGVHGLTLRVRDPLSSGVYFARIRIAGLASTTKVVRLP